MTYQTIQTATHADKVGVITLNRPKQLNALNGELMDELGTALKAYDADPAIGCMVIPAAKKPLPLGPTLAPWPATTLPMCTHKISSPATGKPSARCANR